MRTKRLGHLAVALAGFGLTDIESAEVYRYKKTASTTWKAVGIAAGVAASVIIARQFTRMERFPE